MLFCISSWLLGSVGKWVVCFFGNDTERTLCTKPVDIRQRGDSIRMIVTLVCFRTSLPSVMQALAGQIIFAHLQYFASCGYALLPDNSLSSFVMIILMYNIALLSGTCSVCRMHYEIQTASDKHCRCLGMQLSLHYTASLTTPFSTCQELSSFLDLP